MRLITTEGKSQAIDEVHYRSMINFKLTITRRPELALEFATESLASHRFR